jgi:hypothetical protein
VGRCQTALVDVGSERPPTRQSLRELNSHQADSTAPDHDDPVIAMKIADLLDRADGGQA